MSKSTKSAPSSNPEIHFSPDCDPAEFSLRVFALRRQAWDIMDALDTMTRTFWTSLTQQNHDNTDRNGKSAIQAYRAAENLKDALSDLESFAPAASVMAALDARTK